MPMALVVTSAACSGASSAGPPDVSVQPLPLPGALQTEPQIGQLDLIAAFVLSSHDHHFGGLSGVLVEGSQLQALSDRAWLWQAKLQFDGAGAMVGLSNWQDRQIGDPARDDTEALLRLPDGSLMASEEGPARTLMLSGRMPAAAKHLAPTFADLPKNEGVEALTTMPDGSLFAIGEAGERDGTHRAALLRDNDVTLFHYQAAEGFRPTDVARSGNRLVVLERRLSLLGGFEARIVLLDAASILQASGGLLEGTELARLGPSTISENFEGLALVPRSDGAFTIYVVSDDNFNVLQQTLLLQFVWRPGTAPSG